MVLIKGGRFLMGSPLTEKDRSDNEAQHWVSVLSFYAGKYEVTGAEWEACVADKGCPEDAGSGRGKFPVAGVSWNDAQKYVAWLKQKTGKNYRLLTEAEWEYAARAGTRTAFWWGDDFDAARAQQYSSSSKPVGSYMPNPFGLHDTVGNAYEWVEDCYAQSGGPPDGSANTAGDCSRRVVRGGSWPLFSFSFSLRSAIRRAYYPTDRFFGFRVARTL